MPSKHACTQRIPPPASCPRPGGCCSIASRTCPGVRIDSGVVEGGDVSVHYDPMLAKVIASAETRSLAIARLAAALRAFPILGVRTNVPFLLRILDHPLYRDGRIDTGLSRSRRRRARRRAGRHPRVRSGGAPHTTTKSEGTSHRVARQMGSVAGVSQDRRRLCRVDVDGRNELVYVAGPAADRWVFWNGHVYRGDFDRACHRPPAIRARIGRTVARGDRRADAGDGDQGARQLRARRSRRARRSIVLEAMKMEMPLKAPGDGTVKAVRCREGELVQADVVLVELE